MFPGGPPVPGGTIICGTMTFGVEGGAPPGPGGEVDVGTMTTTGGEGVPPPKVSVGDEYDSVAKTKFVNTPLEKSPLSMNNS